MDTLETDAEDLIEGQKFVDVNGDICTITSTKYDPDDMGGCGDTTCCGVAEYYWVFFTRPDGEQDEYRLWKWEELNVVV